MKKTAGFTLIEVLFASVMMTIVAGIVLYLSSTILNSWQGATEKLTLDSEAQIVLDYMAQDLEGAFFGNREEAWLISNKVSENSLWLRFFTPAMDRDRTNPGDLNAVSYRLLPIEPINATATTNGLSSLYRTVIEAEKTFEDFQGKLESAAESDFLDTSDAQSIGWSFLLGNIVSMDVKYFVRNLSNNGELELEQMVGPNLRFPGEGVEKPAMAEISITILSTEGTRRLEAVVEGLDSTLDVSEIINENGRTFSRQIILLGRPL